MLSVKKTSVPYAAGTAPVFSSRKQTPLILTKCEIYSKISKATIMNLIAFSSRIVASNHYDRVRMKRDHTLGYLPNYNTLSGIPRGKKEALMPLSP